MKPTLAAFVVAALALQASAATPAVRARPALRVTVLSGPPLHPVVGSPWRLVIRVRRGTHAYTGPAPVVSGQGDTRLSARLARTPRRGVFAGTVTFPVSGPWRLSVSVGGRRFSLGTYAADVPVNVALRDPFWVSALADSSLLIGQRQGPVLRWANGQLGVFSALQPVHNVAVTPLGVLASENNRVHRLTTSGQAAAEPLTFEANPVAAGDANGNLYVAFYENRVVRVSPDGTVTPFAGTGEEGFSGDGGPATSAKLFHPHDIAVGPDGAVYIADTENRRIRRVDPRTGVITSFGGDVGIVISLDVASNGSVYSTSVARTEPAAVWHTTSAGSTIIANGHANAVAAAPDGTIYVSMWPEWRVGRVDTSRRIIRTILRGR
jgi:sugar lactone lactonase YvrE